jgi:hypothetical protein
MENEELGMRVDLNALAYDTDLYGRTYDRVEDWLRKELQASGLNFDADQDVASVLLSRGIVPKENWSLTAATKAHPQGQLSMSKETLTPAMFSGPNGAAIASALGYRNRLKTCLSMFMRPWLEQACQYNGRITTNWNQVRNGGDSDGRGGGGTRTGRPSTDKHNFLNISKAWAGRNDGYVHPEFLSVAPLPLCRKYILPDEGHVWLHRDFNGQEMRVFGHFEQGDLWRQYQANPRLDPHEWVRQVILDTTGTELIRTKVKNTNFARLYGGGKGAVYRRAQCSSEREAEEIMKFCDRALPGRELLNKEIKRVVRDPRFKAIRTWGGRLYYPEKPTLDKKTGRLMNWEYKLINYLVQGSAADGTKESIIDWYPHRGASRFLVTVYDENNISAPREDAVRAMRELKRAMEEPRLTVPMLTDPKHGETWGSIAACPPERKCELCS